MKKLLVALFVLGLAAAALAQPGALISPPVVAPNTNEGRYREVVNKINAYETTQSNREVIAGKIWDIGQIEDGSTAYLICDICEGLGSHWWIVAHPERNPVKLPSGRLAGTLHDTYVGPAKAYFVRVVEDSVFFRHNGNTEMARYYDQRIPPNLAELYAEKKRLMDILYPPVK